LGEAAPPAIRCCHEKSARRGESTASLGQREEELELDVVGVSDHHDVVVLDARMRDTERIQSVSLLLQFVVARDFELDVI
jgi:hypothetical protein